MQLLDEHPELDAIFCSSDTLEHGVLIEAQSRGLRVPEEVFTLTINGRYTQETKAVSDSAIDIRSTSALATARVAWLAPR